MLSSHVLLSFPFPAHKSLPPHIAQQQASRLLTGQLMVSMHGGADNNKVALDATGVQLQGALDSLFTYDGPLGYRKTEGGSGTVTLWAPTAQQVVTFF